MLMMLGFSQTLRLLNYRRWHAFLTFFGRYSGLKFNLEKKRGFTQSIALQNKSRPLLFVFPGKISSFPGKYLGLLLHTRRLRKVEFQLLINKIRGRLLGWKGKFLNKVGRKTLVKIVLSSQPIYQLTVFPAQK